MRVVAKISFLEFWRNNIVRLMLLVSVVFVLSGFFLGDLALSEQYKIVVDFSLFILEIFAVLLVLFFGTGLFKKEETQKTINLILLKNPKISNFVLGKYVGFALVLGMFFLVFLSVYLLLSLGLNLFEYSFWGASLWAIVFIYLKILLLLAIVFFFNSFASAIVSFVASFVLYIVGHSLGFLHHIVYQPEYGFSNIQQKLVDILYFVLPNFEQLSLNEQFTQFFSVVNGNNLQSVGIVFLYIFLLLFLSIRIYSYCFTKESK